jgi:glycosyltransferase involved in cell wall biosynthesis
MPGVNLRVIFFGFVGIMAFVHVPLLFIVTHSGTRPMGADGHGNRRPNAVGHRARAGHSDTSPASFMVFGSAVETEPALPKGVNGNESETATPEPPVTEITPAPWTVAFTPDVFSAPAPMSSDAKVRKAQYLPRDAFDFRFEDVLSRTKDAGGGSLRPQIAVVLFATSGPRDWLSLVGEGGSTSVGGGSDRTAELILVVPRDFDANQQLHPLSTRHKRWVQIRLLRCVMANVSSSQDVDVFPVPWSIVPDVAANSKADSIVFFGPGLRYASPNLVTQLDAALWKQSVGGVGTPTIAGCTVVVDDGSVNITHSAGFVVREVENGALTLADTMSGFPFEYIDASVPASAAASNAKLQAKATLQQPCDTNSYVLVPPPLCFAVQSAALTRRWPPPPPPTDQAKAVAQASFVDFSGIAADGVSIEMQAAVDDFVRFALTAAHAVVAGATTLATSANMNATLPVPMVGAAFYRKPQAADAVGAIRVAQPLNRVLVPNSTEADTLRPWLASVARPMPALSPPPLSMGTNGRRRRQDDLRLTDPGVVWDTFCIKCFGFSNEVMHFAVPLEGRIDLRLKNGPDCFCHGTPASFTDALRRLAAPKRFERRFADRESESGSYGGSDGGSRARQADAKHVAVTAMMRHSPVVWVSHKDPGSFPTGVYPGFLRRPDIVVGRAMYEFNKVPANWAGKDQYVDEIWVPSRYVRYVFEAAGFDAKKLFIMPEPVDTRQFNPEAVAPMLLPVRHLGWRLGSNRPGIVVTSAVDEEHHVPLVPSSLRGLRKNFKFLSIFKWESRKAWDVLLKAYFSAFTEEDAVSLYIVSYIYGESERKPDRMLRDAAEIASHINGRKWPDKTPHIEIISEQLSEAELIRLYRSVDAFVMPTRGEGWGLPIIQAMAMGLPTIATNWSGNVDFMTPETSYLLSLNGLRPVPSSAEYGGAPGKMWAEPSEAHLRQLMKQIVANPKEAAAVGRRARRHVVEHYSDDAIAQLVVRRVLRLASDYAAKHEPGPVVPVHGPTHAGRSGADVLLEGHDRGLMP